MTIAECRKRKRELKRMLENIDLMKLALIRSIAIEDMNIADIKRKEKEKENDNHNISCSTVNE